MKFKGGKSMTINNTAALVKSILMDDERAINSDDYLYCKVVEEAMEGTAEFIPVSAFFQNRKDFGVPGFETVRRARQKVQATHPELSACNRVKAGRMEKEQEFRAFAKGDI